MNQKRSAGDSLLIPAYVCDTTASNNGLQHDSYEKSFAHVFVCSDLESLSLRFGVGCLNNVSVVSGGEVYSVNNQEIITAICSKVCPRSCFLAGKGLTIRTRFEFGVLL